MTLPSVDKTPEQSPARGVGSSDSSAVSDLDVEIEAYPLRNQRGEIYHTIPAEKCRIGIVSRRRIGRAPDGKDVELPPETEAAFIRGNGAWLPPLFSEIYGVLPNGASEPTRNPPEQRSRTDGCAPPL